MINNLTKILLATVVVAGVSAVVVKKVKKEDKNTEVVESEDESVLKKIKKYVEKKVIKILAFVAIHAEQIDAISTIIGLVTGVIGIVSAVKEFKRDNDIQEQLNRIEDQMSEYTRVANSNIDAFDQKYNYLGKYINDCGDTIVDNQEKIMSNQIYIAKALKIIPTE